MLSPYTQLKDEDKDIPFRSIKSLNNYLLKNNLFPSPTDYLSLCYNCYKDNKTLLSDDHMLIFTKMLDSIHKYKSHVDNLYEIEDKTIYESLYFIPHTYFQLLGFVSKTENISHIINQLNSYNSGMYDKYIAVSKDEYNKKYTTKNTLYTTHESKNAFISDLISFPPQSKKTSNVYLFSYASFCDSIILLSNKNISTVRFKNTICFQMRNILTFYNELHQQFAISQLERTNEVKFLKQKKMYDIKDEHLKTALHNIQQLREKLEEYEDNLPTENNLYIYTIECNDVSMLDGDDEMNSLPNDVINLIKNKYKMDGTYLFFCDYDTKFKINDNYKLIKKKSERILNFSIFMKDINNIETKRLENKLLDGRILYKVSEQITETINKHVNSYLKLDKSYADYEYGIDKEVMKKEADLFFDFVNKAGSVPTYTNSKSYNEFKRKLGSDGTMYEKEVDERQLIYKPLK